MNLTQRLRLQRWSRLSTPAQPPMRNWLFYILAAIICGSVVTTRGEEISFEQDIRPILKANCFHCHGESDELKGKLDVRLARLILKGGETGPAIVPASLRRVCCWRR